MLANYRCNEIKEQIFAEYEPEFKSFFDASAKQNMSSFKTEAIRITKNMLEKYDEIASNYVEHIYLNVRKQMYAALSQKFYVCFENQAKRILPVSEKFMRKDLQNELKRSKINILFHIR
jgi:hypothetical protein